MFFILIMQCTSSPINAGFLRFERVQRWAVFLGVPCIGEFRFILEKGVIAH
jgi:hypothetical protein